MNLQYLIHLANYSDGVLYVLGALLLVELSVIVDRFWFLRRTRWIGYLPIAERSFWSAGPAPLQGRPGRKALPSARRFGAAPF